MKNNSVSDQNDSITPGRKILLLSVVLISLSPFALNELWFDDASFSSTFWEIQVKNISIFQYIWEIILDWAQINGRFTPLSIMQIYGLHYWIHDVHLYRLGHVSLVLTHLFTFVWLLRKLRLDWNFIGLFLLLLMGTFQARNYHDPIAAYGYFLQSQGIYLTLAIILLLKWSETPRNTWLALSSILAMMSLLMYEINLVFYLIASGLLLVATHSNKLKIRALIIYIIPLLIYVLFTIYLRASIEINYPGLKVGHPGLMLSTYGKQFLGAFPGVFYFTIWKTEFPILKIFTTFIYSPLAWLLMAASLYLTFRCLSPDKLSEVKSLQEKSKFFIIAFSLICIIPIFIAISTKYQYELRWGTAYLPVYYSYFGVGMVLAALLSWITKRFAILRFPIVMVVAMIITTNFLVNRNVVDNVDESFREPQTSLAQSLKDGLFDVLDDGDYVKTDGTQFMNRGYFYRYSGKKVFIANSFGKDKGDHKSMHYTLLRQDTPPYLWEITPEEVSTVFGEGWSVDEGAHRWGVSQLAVISLMNGSGKHADVRVSFDLNTLKPRNISLAINGKPLDQFSSILNGIPVHFEIPLGSLAPGENKLFINTDVPPESPGNGDSRQLTFLISNFSLIKEN
jgi:hypothetical protein